MSIAMLDAIWSALGGDAALVSSVSFSEGAARTQALPSAYAVSDLAAASVAAAALAAAELVALHAGKAPAVTVDRRLASLWFGWTLRPRGAPLPAAWDPIAGDYRARDGWIRLHTNAPAHRAAALWVLEVPAEREAVARAVSAWSADELERLVVREGGCAATMRTVEAWRQHPQGRAVLAEPLVHRERGSRRARGSASFFADRPLSGVRVLDLTRVLAGPVATRFLAGLGADVLRIDAPDWEEPGVIPEVTLGKRCARLDLRKTQDHGRLRELLARADILVHGYRPGALDALGLGVRERAGIAPGLVDVSLDAYGYTGPWCGRRGFDSLVQMSAGIAAEGMRVKGADKPLPLPVQALDHATGYIMAAAALRGLCTRAVGGESSVMRTSLARTAGLLQSGPPGSFESAVDAAADADYAPEDEPTTWGAMQRLRPPVSVLGCPLRWPLPASALGTAEAAWV